jgi:O-succinylbenzoate synthase
MKINEIELRHLSIPLKESFRTSTEIKNHIEHVIVMVKGGDIVGYGESTCNQTPYYINETTETAWHILSKFIINIIKLLEGIILLKRELN